MKLTILVRENRCIGWLAQPHERFEAVAHGAIWGGSLHVYGPTEEAVVEKIKKVLQGNYQDWKQVEVDV